MPTIRTVRLAVSAGLLVYAAPGPAPAAESYDSCAGTIASLPATISTQGVWCLNKDLATSLASGVAVTVAANNVTIDCNGFKLGGLSAGVGTTTTGISLGDTMNGVVRNCNVRGFLVGIDSGASGSGHLVEDNRLDGNTFAGIRVLGANSTVRRNLVFDTGQSTATEAPSGIAVAHGVDVLDNTIAGVTPSGNPNETVGIRATANDNGTISGNRIRGLVPPTGGATIGVYTTAGYGLVSGNHMFGSVDYRMNFGVFCSSALTTSHANVFGNVDTPTGNCHSVGDVHNPY